MVDLKAFRKVNSLTQIDLANYFSVGQGFISQIEKGDRPIPKEYISRLLANPYGWDVSMLKGRGDENVVEEKPAQDEAITTLLGLLAEKDKDIRTLIEMLKKKDEKIDELQEELRYYREKRETARTAADSLSASAV